MSTIRIPPVLRPQADGLRTVNADGATVGEVLRQVADRFPGLGQQLFGDEGLHKFVNVYVNDQDVQYLQKMETPVGADDTVIILPAMAGGA